MNRSASQLLSVDLIFEALTAVALIAVPGIATTLIFSPHLPPEIPGLLRIAGIGLGLFTIGCWLAWRRGKARAVRTVLTGYNIVAIVLLAIFGIAYDPIGPLLWPAVAIHAALTIGLICIDRR